MYELTIGAVLLAVLLQLLYIVVLAALVAGILTLGKKLVYDAPNDFVEIFGTILYGVSTVVVVILAIVISAETWHGLLTGRW